ncbi:MAG: hypothetical protein R3C10_06450 [Pirellulales bacterium]
MRFSLRGMLLVTALLGVYFACWGPTQSRGLDDVEAYLNDRGLAGKPTATPIAPLLLSAERVESTSVADGMLQLVTTREYFVWCFGAVARLPFTTTGHREQEVRKGKGTWILVGRSESEPRILPENAGGSAERAPAEVTAHSKETVETPDRRNGPRDAE